MSDYTVGEMETVNAQFFGIDAEEVAHISVTIQTIYGEVRSIGCAHVMELAQTTLQMKKDRRNVGNQAPYPRAHDDGNIGKAFGNQRKNRMARIMSFLQFRARIRY